jgi:manganese transport protein
VIFAVALLLSGVGSTITSGMAAGSIMAGMFREPYDIADSHSRLGVGISLVFAMLIIFFISNPFNGLIISQVVLSLQLPLTVFLQVKLTSSEKVMGKFRNNRLMKYILVLLGIIVALLNLSLVISILIK